MNTGSPDIHNKRSSVSAIDPKTSKIQSVLQIKPSNYFRKILNGISRIGGYVGGSLFYKAIIVLYMMTTIINQFVITLSTKMDSFCSPLNVTIFICQLEAIIVFFFGIYHIDSNFLQQLAQHLSVVALMPISLNIKANIDMNSIMEDDYVMLITTPLNDRVLLNNAKIADNLSFRKKNKAYKLIKTEVMICIIWISVTYITGYIIIDDMVRYPHPTKDIWYYVWTATNIFDIIRYIPSAILIFFIRCYMRTFEYELVCFRRKYGILYRYECVNAQNQNLYNTEFKRIRKYNHNFDPFKYAQNEDSTLGLGSSLLLNSGGANSPLHHRFDKKASFQQEIEEDDALYVVALSLTHFEFKNELECILHPYRNMSRELKYLFATYLFINTVSFVFVGITIIKELTGNCMTDHTYYIHYVVEMGTYFIAWILLMIPLAENHRVLARLNKDIRAKIVCDYPQEQILIHHYLHSLCESSPFCIAYIQPTYYHLITCLYLIFGLIGLDLITYFSKNISFFGLFS